MIARKIFKLSLLFAHHVKNVVLDNIQFEAKSPDSLSAVTLQNVTDIKTDGSVDPTIIP